MNQTLIIIAIILITGIIMLKAFYTKSSDVDMDVKTFKEKVKAQPGLIIDVRTREEYEEGHLSKTDHQYDFLSGEFHEQLENFDKDQTYYLYCRSGNRSGQAARIMKNKGFSSVYNIGGFEELADAGFEAE